jgi:hypothetical protein
MVAGMGKSNWKWKKMAVSEISSTKHQITNKFQYGSINFNGSLEQSYFEFV